MISRRRLLLVEPIRTKKYPVEVAQSSNAKVEKSGLGLVENARKFDAQSKTRPSCKLRDSFLARLANNLSRTESAVTTRLYTYSSTARSNADLNDLNDSILATGEFLIERRIF